MEFRYSQVTIEALGYTLPESRFTSSDIEQALAPLYDRLGLPAGRLELMTGIQERRLWPPATRISDISASSCRLALEAAGADPLDVDALIHGSVCREFLEPATACRVHHLIGASPKCQIYDVSNACLGILNGIVQGASLIELGQARRVLVVGSENGFGLVDTTVQSLNADTELTRKTVKSSIASLTIGSASCAVLLGRAEDHSRASRLLGGVAGANSAFHDLCQSSGDAHGGVAQPLMETDSETLMLEGVKTGRETFERFLAAMNWRRNDLGATVCHQVGAAHRKLLLESLELPAESDYVTYPFLGNTGSAALPVSFARALEERFIPGRARVALMGIGSGINCLILALQAGRTPVLGHSTDEVWP
jgi:3-oxoacyl-[acyl-carrier-protein] synthase-3